MSLRGKLHAIHICLSQARTCPEADDEGNPYRLHNAGGTTRGTAQDSDARLGAP